MEKIKMEVYEGSVDLGDFGTLADQIGAKGTIKFNNKNFDNPEKRVVVIAKNDQDESAVISCSEPLSRQLRKAKVAGASSKELLAQVIALPIYGNEIGQFIGLPAGEATEGISVADLKKVKVTTKVATNPEELAW